MRTTTLHNQSYNPDQIAGMAFALWEQAGRPDGQDQEFWFKAEQQLTGATKPAPNSSGQSRTKSSPNGLTTAFKFKPEQEGKTTTITRKQLAAPRERQAATAAVSRTR